MYLQRGVVTSLPAGMQDLQTKQRHRAHNNHAGSHPTTSCSREFLKISLSRPTEWRMRRIRADYGAREPWYGKCHLRAGVSLRKLVRKSGESNPIHFCGCQVFFLSSILFFLFLFSFFFFLFSFSFSFIFSSLFLLFFFLSYFLFFLFLFSFVFFFFSWKVL